MGIEVIEDDVSLECIKLRMPVYPVVGREEGVFRAHQTSMERGPG